MLIDYSDEECPFLGLKIALKASIVLTLPGRNFYNSYLDIGGGETRPLKAAAVVLPGP